jgi:hypothetical protein
MVVFFQLLCLFQAVYQVPFPIKYLEFLEWLRLLNAQWLYVFRLQCLSHIDYHNVLDLTITMFSILLLVQVGCEVAISFAGDRASRVSRVAHKLAGWVAAATSLVYPGFSATIFQAFNCITVDGSRYVRADLSIGCDSPSHVSKQGSAVFGIVVCCFGAPLLYWWILRSGQGWKDGHCEHLKFFVREYKPRYWYWEIVEIFKKLVLAGFAAMWLPGTLMQLIMSMFVVIAALLATCVCRPYRGTTEYRPDHDNDAGDDVRPLQARCHEIMQSESISNWFAMCTGLATFATLFGALLVKINSSYQSSGLYEEGYSYALLEWGLICVAAAVGILGLLLILDDLRIVPTVRFARRVLEVVQRRLLPDAMRNYITRTAAPAPDREGRRDVTALKHVHQCHLDLLLKAPPSAEWLGTTRTDLEDAVTVLEALITAARPVAATAPPSRASAVAPTPDPDDSA